VTITASRIYTLHCNTYIIFYVFISRCLVTPLNNVDSSALALTSLPAGYHLTTNSWPQLTQFGESVKLLLALASTVIPGFSPGDPWPRFLFYPRHVLEVGPALRRQFRVKVTLRPTVSRPVSVSSHIWGPRPDFCYCQTFAVLSMWGALSDKRTGLSFVAAIVSSTWRIPCRGYVFSELLPSSGRFLLAPLFRLSGVMSIIL
jgi:hypothetical protein